MKNDPVDRASEALNAAALRYAVRHMDEDAYRELRACAVELAIALLKQGAEMDPLRKKKLLGGLYMLEVFVAGCRS